MFKKNIKIKCLLLILLILFSFFIKKHILSIYANIIAFISLIFILKCIQVQKDKIKNRNIKNRNIYISILATLPLLIASILYYNNIDFIIRNRSVMTKEEMFYTSIIFFLLWLILFLRIIYRHYINNKK